MFSRRLLHLLALGFFGHLPPLLAQTRVACVGDSITEGYGLSSPNQEAYPAQLQVLLGPDYQVQNFGVSGSTARKQGDKPYWAQGAYGASTSFAPNVVLLMLGTNDAKPANWNEAAFRVDYSALVEHYADLGAQVYVATPPKVFGSGAFDITPTTVNDVVVPIVHELAADTGATLVDVYAATEPHGDWFPDNVHPSREGAALLAQTFADALSEEHTTTGGVAPTTSEASATSDPVSTLGSSDRPRESSAMSWDASSVSSVTSEPGRNPSSEPLTSGTVSSAPSNPTTIGVTTPTATSNTDAATGPSIVSPTASSSSAGTPAQPPVPSASEREASCSSAASRSASFGGVPALLVAASALAVWRRRRRVNTAPRRAGLATRYGERRAS